MAEQDSKPKSEEQESKPQEIHQAGVISARRLLPVGLGLVILLVGCYWWGSQPSETKRQEILETPVIIQSSAVTRPAQSAAALTRVAASLAQAHGPTATPILQSTASAVATVPLPTVTPTIIPSPVATRTIEINGNATLRLQLNNDTFATSGQPITIDIEPHSYILGGDTMTSQDQWCMQVGPTGLVFDLILTLQPITENLHIGGELQLYDGFCGTWGNLGNRLSTAPMNVTVPAGSTARLAPTLQVQGSLLGVPNLLDISTAISLEMSIRNPSPR